MITRHFFILGECNGLLGENFILWDFLFVTQVIKTKRQVVIVNEIRGLFYRSIDPFIHHGVQIRTQTDKN